MSNLLRRLGRHRHRPPARHEAFAALRHPERHTMKQCAFCGRRVRQLLHGVCRRQWCQRFWKEFSR